MVTVDILLLRKVRGKYQLLLIQRGQSPYHGKWALPGGYVDLDESLESAARRELFEETNIRDIPFRQLGAFGDPGRDPRGHTVTVVYGGIIPPNTRLKAIAKDDAANLSWHPLDKLPGLAFDHKTIIQQGIQKLKEIGMIENV